MLIPSVSDPFANSECKIQLQIQGKFKAMFWATVQILLVTWPELQVCSLSQNIFGHWQYKKLVSDVIKVLTL